MPCCRVATAASGAAQHAMRAKAKAKRQAAKAEEEVKEAAKEEEAEPEPEYTGARKYFHKAIDFLDQLWLQTSLYVVFLLAFQSLTGTMRHPLPGALVPRCSSRARALDDSVLGDDAAALAVAS